MKQFLFALAGIASAFCLGTSPSSAGSPYQTDDPGTTGDGQFEFNLASVGTHVRGDATDAVTASLSIGLSDNWELDFSVPYQFSDQPHRRAHSGMGDYDIATKVRFLSQDDFGLDVAFAPAVDIPVQGSKVATSANDTTLFLPLWFEKDWGNWSSFAGIAYDRDLERGGNDFVYLGWALTNQITPDLNVGVEIYHLTPNANGGKASTSLTFGANYSFTDALQLQLAISPGIQNADATNLFTYTVALDYTL